MASKIVLHIGLQKSGTTFLQHMLQDNTEALAEADVLYPIPSDWDRGRRTVANHEWSSYGLLGTEYPWVSQQRASGESASWQALLDQVKAWPRTALLSAEAMSVLRSDAVRRLMDSLGVDDVEVLITARSLGRALPSLWQQHIRNGRSVSLESYLGTLAKQRSKGWDHIESDPAAHIWRAFTLSRLVQRWSDAGASRVSVVTTPGNPPDLLWQRFTQAIGIPDLAQAQAMQDRQAHTGLTAPETLVLASLNAALGDWPERKADQVRRIVTDRFQARLRRGSKVAIPPEWRPRLAEWSQEDLTALQATPAHLIGDIDDLRYDPTTEKASPPTPEETAQAGAEATLAFADLALRTSPTRRRTHRLRRLLS